MGCLFSACRGAGDTKLEPLLPAGEQSSVVVNSPDEQSGAVATHPDGAPLGAGSSHAAYMCTAQAGQAPAQVGQPSSSSQGGSPSFSPFGQAAQDPARPQEETLTPFRAVQRLLGTPKSWGVGWKSGSSGGVYGRLGSGPPAPSSWGSNPNALTRGSVPSPTYYDDSPGGMRMVMG